MKKPVFKRIVLKVSGEALQGAKAHGIDNNVLLAICRQIREIKQLGVEIAIVLGGGNIFRGQENSASLGLDMDRSVADYMGMLATVINGMALQSALESAGVFTRLISAIEMRQIAEPYIRRRAIRHLEKGRVLIFSAGTGNPYFTTDSAAALRASEINADAILKGTRVEGIYDHDPEKNPNAKKFDVLSFDQVIGMDLKVMDMTAFTICKENNIPIIVFNINDESNLIGIIQGKKIGTVVS